MYGLICVVPEADGPIYYDDTSSDDYEAQSKPGFGWLEGKTFQLHKQAGTLFADLTEQLYVATSQDADDIATRNGLVRHVRLIEKIHGWNLKVAIRFFLDTLQEIRQAKKDDTNPQECRLGFCYNGCTESDLDALVAAVEEALRVGNTHVERLDAWHNIRLGNFCHELQQMLFWTVYDLGIQDGVISRFQDILGSQFTLQEMRKTPAQELSVA